MTTVTVQRAGTVEDPFSGEQITDWSNPTTWSVDDCIVEPRTTSEPLEGGRTPVITGYILHMPHGTDIHYDDRVILLGQSWDVDGMPFEWENPFTGWKAGVEVRLKKVDG